MLHSDLYTVSANGQIQRWSGAFNCISSWQGHDGIILSSVITRMGPNSDSFSLVTGANDGAIKVTPPSKIQQAFSDARRSGTSRLLQVKRRSVAHSSEMIKVTLIYT
jgi:di- and tripeptidase